MRDDLGGNHAARTAAIVDHHLLPDAARERLRRETSENVRGAAWGIADDHADRLIGIRLRAHRSRQQRT